MNNPNNANSIYLRTRLTCSSKQFGTLGHNKINGPFPIVSTIFIITCVFYLANCSDTLAETISPIRTESITNFSQSEKSHQLFDKVKNSVIQIDTLIQYVNPKITVDDQPFLNEPTGLIGSGFIYDKSGKIVQIIMLYVTPKPF